MGGVDAAEHGDVLGRELRREHAPSQPRHSSHAADASHAPAGRGHLLQHGARHLGTHTRQQEAAPVTGCCRRNAALPAPPPPPESSRHALLNAITGKKKEPDIIPFQFSHLITNKQPLRGGVTHSGDRGNHVTAGGYPEGRATQEQVNLSVHTSTEGMEPT